VSMILLVGYLVLLHFVTDTILKFERFKDINLLQQLMIILIVFSVGMLLPVQFGMHYADALLFSIFSTAWRGIFSIVSKVLA
jgi:hypothetical protein